MKRGIVAGLGGLLMALGLGVAGLTDARRIIGFLDVLGHWDPTALIVMAAASVTYGLGYRALGHRPTREPAARAVSLPLVVGAALFGIGWGLSGLCPGPALIVVASGQLAVIVFVAAMVAGMLVYARFAARSGSTVLRSPPA